MVVDAGSCGDVVDVILQVGGASLFGTGVVGLVPLGGGVVVDGSIAIDGG